eukprot:gene14161-16690_t
MFRSSSLSVVTTIRRIDVLTRRCYSATAASAVKAPRLKVVDQIKGTTTVKYTPAPVTAPKIKTSSYVAPAATSTPAAAADNKSAFVSSHYKVNEASVLQYLDRKKMAYRVSGQEIVVKECPLCPDTKGKLDNLWKLYISRETSAYFCHRCSNKGSWFDLKANLGDLSFSQIAASGATPEPVTSAEDMKKMAGYADNLEAHADVVKLLTGSQAGERGLTLDVCKLYKVGVTTQAFFDNDKWVDHKCITFPWTTVDKKGGITVVRTKLRALANKALQRIEPKGGRWGFFGWHTVPADARDIVLTEGEYDAMAVHQATGMPTISLPNGATSLPVTLLPLLERFERIFLWMDDDVPGQEGAAKFAEKLGIKRTYIVRTRLGSDAASGPKDANDALRAGADLRAIIASASNVPHSHICDFSDVRSLIQSELQRPETVGGVPSKWLPGFNRTLRGHRKGELTIFSGPTGIGKTTLLSQLSLDFCTQGTRTLWGSFEIKVARLAKKMMSQYACVSLESNVADYDRLANEFAALPMYFLRFFGSTQVDKVLDAMEYAVYVHDVEHIVLDNLQFMMSGQGRGIEKFDNMDDSIEKLRLFATQKNVHITVVIHPRKQDVESTLNINDIFGTAKATQNGKNHRYLDVKKNRFSGKLGTIPLSECL